MAQVLPQDNLGRTGLPVTRLGYGAMELRGPRIWSGRPLSDGQAERILNAVLDAGINFIDTSPDYGRSEEYIGRFIAHRRAEYYLATKCGCTVVPVDDRIDTTPHVWTRDNLFRNIHESLSRLQTAYVDIIQLHNPTVEQVEAGNLVAAMQEMKAQGLVRWLGVSTTLPDLPRYLEIGVFDTFQLPYSALQRTHEEWISRVAKRNIGTIIRGGVARGEPGAGQGAEARWEAFARANLDELRAPGESRTTFLLRFTLAHQDIHTVIIGTLSPEHLREDVTATLFDPLPPDVYLEAKRRLDDTGLRAEAA